MSSSETFNPPSEAQYLIMINELETDPEFFEKHRVCNSGPLWQRVVDKMNAVPGPKRNVEEWRAACKGLKWFVRKKYRAVDPNIPGSLTNFTEVQRKLLLVLGKLDVNSCRKCNKKHTDKEIFYPLFEDMNTLTTLTEKAKIYTKITKMQILQYDMLPHWLCSECWKKCEDWHDFIKNCKRFNDNNYKISMDNSYKTMVKPKKIVPYKRSLPKKKQTPILTLKSPKTSTDLLNLDPVETIFLKQEPLDIKLEENVDMAHNSSFVMTGNNESDDIDMKANIKQEEA